jgi:hypothetical protein
LNSSELETDTFNKLNHELKLVVTNPVGESKETASISREIMEGYSWFTPVLEGNYSYIYPYRHR